MRRFIRTGSLLSLVLMFALTAGCASLSFSNRGVPLGTFYVDANVNEQVTENAMDSSKKGEGCATSILGWVVTGDASVASAMQDGGITRVATVDNKYTNILGLFATYCVQVRGS